VDYKEKWRLDLLTEPNAVSVPPKAWLKYFELETQELKSRGLLIDQKISILDLKNLAESDVSNRVLFVATMMWGRGPKNGRLMPKFRKVCSSPVFEETLHKTRDLITVGNPVGAYRAWIDSGISGIREPFFTKWFFVCGLAEGGSVFRPLVLDGRVWRSLSAISWSSEEQTGNKYRKDPAGAYGAYSHAMEHWSSELSDEVAKITPLQVEQFFFRKNGNSLL